MVTDHTGVCGISTGSQCQYVTLSTAKTVKLTELEIFVSIFKTNEDYFNKEMYDIFHFGSI